MNAIRLFGALVLVVVCLSFCLANEQTGSVAISIINRPPKITDVSVVPENAYPDSVLRCVPVVEDERVDEVFFEYEWRVNGELSVEENSEFINARAGDVVECSVIGYDNQGAWSNTVSASVSILEPSQRLKLTRAILGVFEDADYEKAAEIEDAGGITGYVVYEGMGEQNVKWTLGIIVFLVTVINLNLVLRHRNKHR